MSTNNAYLDIHGNGFPAGRGYEAYNNTFLPGGYCVDFRGGGGVIYNNTFIGTEAGVLLEQDNYNASAPNNPMYVNDVWIWSNTYTSVGINFEVEPTVGIVAGVNYFKDASDGTTATSPAPPRPGYTPYTYPHPLTLGG